MKKLLIVIALLTSASSFAAGTFYCAVDVDGNQIDGSQVTKEITKEITKKSSLIHKIGDFYAYSAEVTAEGGFGEVYILDKVTGFKAELTDVSSGFASRVGEDTEVLVELKNQNGGILGNKDIKSLTVNCSIEY